MTRAAAAVLLAMGAAAARAQTFEVASIKPSATTERDFGGGPGTSDPGQYHSTHTTLLDLLASAYQVDRFQISSKVALDKNRYDVAAKIQAGATRDQFRRMLKNLLSERFQLQVHVESRPFPAYELTIAKAGLRMKEAAPAIGPVPEPGGRPEIKDGFPALPPGTAGGAERHSFEGAYELVRMAIRKQPMNMIVRLLRTPEGEPIVDHTGLTGEYDFTLEYTKETSVSRAGNSEPPAVPALPQAVLEQLGLRMTLKKLPFDVVVIDSVNLVPIEY